MEVAPAGSATADRDRPPCTDPMNDRRKSDLGRAEAAVEAGMGEQDWSYTKLSARIRASANVPGHRAMHAAVLVLRITHLLQVSFSAIYCLCNLQEKNAH